MFRSRAMALLCRTQGGVNRDHVNLLKSVLRLPSGKIDSRMPQRPEIAADRNIHRPSGDGRPAPYPPIATEECSHHAGPRTTHTTARIPDDRLAVEGEAFMLPRNITERAITHIWSNALGREVSSITDDFFDLGGSSITALAIIMDVEDFFNIQLPVEILFTNRTVMALAHTIDKLLSATNRYSPIVPIQPNGRRQAFFACPGHNGDVYCFLQLARHLGSDQPFYALQPPGLSGGNKCTEKIEDLASLYVKELLTFQEHGPFLLGGFCLGGTIIFEVARQLRACGQDVALLVFLGCACPTSFSLRNRISAKINLGITRVRYHLRIVRSLPISEEITYIRDRVKHQLRRGSVAPNGVAPYQSPRQIAVGRTSVLAARHYRKRMQPYDGKITLFLPCREWISTADRPMDWRRFAKKGVETFIGPDHCHVDRMLLEPDVRIFARELRLRLDQLDTSHKLALVQ